MVMKVSASAFLSTWSPFQTQPIAVQQQQTHSSLSPSASRWTALARITNSPSSTDAKLQVSAFSGRRVSLWTKPRHFRTHHPQQQQQQQQQRTTTTMLVDPWSVSPEAIDQLAVQFFGASLFPYLAFLYFLNRKEVECPPVANFGFRFLLVFVFATIPAGIYAKQAYGTILANVDWLHGTAESLLTITNLLIVVGFRQALASINNKASPISSTASASDKDANVESTEKLQASPMATATSILLPIAVQTVAAATTAVFTFAHAEPSNALSLPTWIVHASSLLEWLAAMALVWEYAEATGRPQWKGLVWGMLPLHTSGICACTYHLFYNAAALNGVVALQAGLTCFGNALMAIAVWRIVQASAADGTGKEELQQQDQVVQLAGIGADGQGEKSQLKLDSQLPNGVYYGRLAVGTIALSAAVKWGSLAVDWPFDPTAAGAAALITVPTAVNMLKWAVRSKTGKKLLGGLL